MSLSLAFSAPASNSSDSIGARTASTYMSEVQVAGTPALESDPVMGLNAVGAALQALSIQDAATVLEALAEQATALSLIIAADAAGAITLPESLRAVVQSATVLPAFLSGAN